MLKDNHSTVESIEKFKATKGSSMNAKDAPHLTVACTWPFKEKIHLIVKQNKKSSRVLDMNKLKAVLCCTICINIRMTESSDILTFKKILLEMDANTSTSQG